MASLVLLNNFMHDFSAAGWLFSSVLVALFLRRELPSGEGGAVVLSLLSSVLLLMRWALVGIVVFGVVRALAYKQYEWNEAAGQAQVTLLIVKHVLLTGVFAVGLVYYLKARRLIRESAHAG